MGSSRQKSANGEGKPRTGSSTAPIPLPLTSLVGRGQEVEQVAGLLRSGQVRLLTLSGPGGVGKTRLALQVAAELHGSFSGGAFFVSLAPVSNPDLVLSTIAETLGVRESNGQTLLSSLCSALENRHLLLILDNFEQILAAGTEVAELLTCAPRLHALVTSRALLHVYGEHEYPVAPLALPDSSVQSSLEQLAQYEAVRLFIERARAAKPGFTVNNKNAPAVAEICHRLDGLPLAIELAAARIKLMSPQALLQRLDRTLPLLTGGPVNLPQRHQTLRNAIAWSYDLLTEEERELFRNLSVFVGGCTLEAAEDICASGGRQTTDDGRQLLNPKSTILDGLAALIDKSLLRHNEPEDSPDAEIEARRQESTRFSMLETIREFALEALGASGDEAAIRKRHARYFLELAERTEPELLGPDQSMWLDTLAQEHDNMRAALLWAQQTGDTETGVRLSTALFRFWFVRGYWSEGRRWLRDALERGSEVGALIRAKALIRLGNLAGSQSDYEAARGYHTQALELADALGDRATGAVALSNLGNTARLQGDYARSIANFERGLAINRELGNKWHVAMTLRNLSVVASEQGDYDRARRTSEEALAMQSELGEQQGIATSLDDLGNVAASQGDYSAAREYYEQALDLWREIGDKAGEAGTLQGLGETLAVEGDYRTAREFQSRSLIARYEMGTRRGVVECLQGLAVVDAEQARPGRVVRLLAAAEALSKAIGAPITSQERSRFERGLGLAREALGPDAFQAAWEEGKALSIEAAVALALEESSSEVTPSASYVAGTSPLTANVQRPGSDLTTREVEVLRLVAAGLTNPAIAAHLNVSINTAQTHLRSIFSKINVNTRGAAVRYAFEHNLS